MVKFRLIKSGKGPNKYQILEEGKLRANFRTKREAQSSIKRLRKGKGI